MPAKKKLSSNAQIAMAMQRYREDPANRGKLPAKESKGHEPEGGFSWASIIIRLKKERKLTAAALMKKQGYEVIRKKAPLPTNAEIAKAMQSYREDPVNKGNLPESGSKGHEPIGVLSWRQIIRRLKEDRDLTQVELMKQEGYEVIRKKAPLPTNAEIAMAMQSYREDPINKGNLPKIGSKGHEPEGGLGWSSIILRLKKERKFSPTALMKQEGYEGRNKGKIRSKVSGNNKIKKTSFLATNADIAKAIENYRKDPANNRRIPTASSKGHEPEGGRGWSSILERLRDERGLSPTTLMKQEGYEGRKQKAPLPANDVIAKAMQRFREALPNKGTLPISTSKGYEPEGGLGWGSIIDRLRKERKLTSTALMKQEGYEGKIYSFDKDDQIWLPDIFNGAVRFIRAHKRLPINEDDILAGRSVVQLRNVFQRKAVEGFASIPALQGIDKELFPDTYEAFLAAAGLAIYELQTRALILPEDYKSKLTPIVS